MDATARTGVPAWYWVVAGAALLWELAGCYAYVTQVTMSTADLAALPAGQRELWLAMPFWVTAVYAIAVWVGLAGAVALALRRRWATTAFAVSLAAVIVQFGWVFVATPALGTLGPSAAAFPAFVILLGALLLWFAGWARKRGWLR